MAVEASSWLGTPYHAHQRLKGGGVDCVHMICAVYEACGLVPPIDPGAYAISWHLHRDEELYMAALDARANRTEHPQVGDIALFRFGRTFSHAGIVVEGGQLVHAYNRAGGGSVIKTSLSQAPLTGRSGPRPTIFYDLYSIRSL